MNELALAKMRKVISLIIGLFLLGFLNSILAQKVSFHVNAGRALPQEENIGAGFETGFGFSLSANEKISLSFDFSYWKSEVSEQHSHLYKGKLTITPFLFSIQYSLFEQETFVPYIFAGTGFIFSSMDIDSMVTIPEISISQKIENGICFLCGAGGRIHISDNLDLLAEGVYLYRTSSGETTISDLNLGVTKEQFSVDMSAIVLRVGIKYFI